MCLESVAWASTRFVVDAGSTDATTAIAGQLGAELIAHPWTGYSDQKNWALENLPLRSEWVLFLDADERLPQDLADEIKKAIAEPADKVAGYYIARKMIFLGRWLRRTYWYPDSNLRLFRRGKGRFQTRLVQARTVLTGPAGYLKSPLIHEDMRDLSTYVSRLNRYSTLEALEMYRRPDAPVGMRFTGSRFGEPSQRRRALKETVWYDLPFAPTLRFILA